MALRIPADVAVLPGMAPAAPRRNALVLIGYLILAGVATSVVFGSF